jgi:starch-binding outer membrane protein SusE/F
MKKISFYRVLALIAFAILLVISCTKETANVRLEAKLSTSQVLDVTADSATVVGFIVAAGDGFTEKGVCYDIATAPTTAKSKLAFDGTATVATFNVRIGSLAYATKYYARAYGINASGTVYGDEVSFTTLPVGPTVTTDSINSITGTTAKVYGTVTVTGGSAVTARGVVYSKTHNPTTGDSKTVNGTGAGNFTAALTGLEGLTKYYVRAYATNTAGTGYGVEDSLTTLVSIQTWNIPGDYVTASYPGTTLGNWAPDQSPQVKSTKASPNNIEGYVYMANGTNQWKFATKPNWDGPNYGDGGSGTLSASGDNFSSTTGYYKLNVNTGVSPYTYTAVATTWGVIGDATPAGWGDETGLVYNPATRTWNGGMHILATKSFKFRANHSWDYNYGAPAGKDTLSAGGDNIASTIEADYAFTLDLSHPNAYTFSANYWGIIGDATPGGWGSDQLMTWDGVNHVFTVTADLTVGAFKFRANGAWTLNLGGSLGALTPGGDNIPIATAGNYTIKLNPWTNVATVTMNAK